MTHAVAPGRIPEWTLNDRLRKARETAGLTQAKLAELTGISQRSVSAYESEGTNVKRPQIVIWALCTGSDLDWLLTGSVGHTHGPTDPSNNERPRSDSNGRPPVYNSEASVVDLNIRRQARNARIMPSWPNRDQEVA